MEEALIALLASVAGGRRYWVNAPAKLPDGSLLPKPYVVLNRITGFRDYAMKGATGFVESRVQCDVYGDTYTSAKTTARALVAALSGYRGTVGQTDIQGIMIDTERDLFTADAGDVQRLFRISIDIMIYHGETS